jgi:hypothetical protein
MSTRLPPMSFCGEEPAAGAIAKTAVLRAPPAPIALTALTPEELPDGWSGSTATALSFQTAISAKVARPGVILPWSTVCKAINDALNSRFLEVAAGGPVSWPCEAQSAAAVEFRLPTTATTGTAGGAGQPPALELAIAQGSLDGAAIVALADAMADVLATVAAYGTPLIFKVSVLTRRMYSCRVLGPSRRIARSSISRWRNGLMALSVMGGSCLGCGSRPLNIKTGRPSAATPRTLFSLQVTARAV